MFKRVLFPVLQFFAFLGLMFAGGNWDSINMSYEIRQMSHGAPLSAVHPLMTTVKFPVGAHVLIAQGIIFATTLLVVILIIQALRKKVIPAAYFTVLAFVAAVVVGLASKMGLPPAN
jgi:hypothetical protein